MGSEENQKRFLKQRKRTKNYVTVFKYVKLSTFAPTNKFLFLRN